MVDSDSQRAALHVFAGFSGELDPGDPFVQWDYPLFHGPTGAGFESAELDVPPGKTIMPV